MRIKISKEKKVFEYNVTRKNGHTFTRLFTLKEIESDHFRLFLTRNCINDDDLVVSLNLDKDENQRRKTP